MRALAAQTSLHTLGWLFLANSIGIILSLLLLFPTLGSYGGPATFGRLVPLHLDFHLYGTMSVPLLGLLLAWLVPSARISRLYLKIWFWSWSLTVCCGGLSWLLGESSGKLFLEWSGLVAWLFVAELVLLFCMLCWGMAPHGKLVRSTLNRLNTWTKGAVLMFLAAVPLAFIIALRPDIYPPVDIATGGATGSALLVSSLALIALLIFFPLLLTRQETPGYFRVRNVTLLLLAHTLGWSFLSHGNSSNRDLEQQLGLFSLLIWVPILPGYFRTFTWHAETLRWLRALAFWGITLVFGASLLFLPSMLAAARFTNTLVAHVHQAMAGALLSMVMIILSQLTPDLALRRILSAHLPFWLWQISLLVFLLVSLKLGVLQAQEAQLFFRESTLRTLWFSVRLAAGVGMWIASGYWLLKVILLERATNPEWQSET
jgi:cytochrome c oxidase cbb3-type subunit 1